MLSGVNKVVRAGQAAMYRADEPAGLDPLALTITIGKATTLAKPRLKSAAAPEVFTRYVSE